MLDIANLDASDSDNGKKKLSLFRLNWKGKTSIAKSFKKYENWTKEKNRGKKGK